MKCPQPRDSGPRIERIASGEFQAMGIPELSPRFRTRAEGEEWLRKHIAALPAALRPRERACLRCGGAFLSEGFHNRMCPRCRSRASDDTLPTIAVAAGTGKILRAARS